MKCLDPYVTGTAAYPCGRCSPCLHNRRRVWTHRMMLEQLEHEHSSFVTLTYGDGYVPDDGSLRPKDLQDWLKRFRERVYPRRIRFFAVGEYGDRTGRPHYHLALFGHDSCGGGIARRGVCECPACLDVRETWGFGHVMVAELTCSSAAYIAGYVTKNMRDRRDPRLFGREPEFARMSLRPGIGANAMWDVASVMMRYGENLSDVPAILRQGSMTMPLGRYLRRKLRVMSGRDEKAPEETLRAAVEDVQALFDYARSFIRKGEVRRLFVKNAIVDANEGAASRYKHKERNTI